MARGDNTCAPEEATSLRCRRLEGEVIRMPPVPTAKVTKMSTPPDALPAYRLLTGVDDAAFCHRVSAALQLGYQLYGSPAVTFNGQDVIVAQAVLWPTEGPPPQSQTGG